MVEVEERDAAADSVRLRGGDSASSRSARARRRRSWCSAAGDGAAVVLARVARRAAGADAAVKPAAEPFEITDNSFLVEEAFNQEAGIFQNIFDAVRDDGDWALDLHAGVAGRLAGAPVLVHAVVARRRRTASALGDTLLNYRYQALMEGPGRPAFSPRVSLILPTGNVGTAAARDRPGLQVNLPFSKQTGDVYWHWNGGLTWLPARRVAGSESQQPG